MSLLQPCAAQGRLSATSTDFPLEWSAVAAVALIDIIWARRIGLSLSASGRGAVVLITVLVAGVALRAMLRRNRVSLCVEFIALSVAATTGFGVLSYLCCAIANPLVDKQLLQLDRAIGFDWQFWFRAIVAHPAIEFVLRNTYNSLVYQGIYFAALFGLLGRRGRLRETFWIIFVAGVLTSAGSVFLPALGAYDAFGLRHLSDYIPDMEKLRAGADLHFELGNLTGIVTFPSFHTTMALIYCYAFRRTETIGYILVALNIAMLPAIPFFGGHYLGDMLGGAVVAAVSIMVARGVPAFNERRQPEGFANTSLGSIRQLGSG